MKNKIRQKSEKVNTNFELGQYVKLRIYKNKIFQLTVRVKLEKCTKQNFVFNFLAF